MFKKPKKGDSIMTEFIFSLIINAILLLYPMWRIYKRAGLNRFLSLTVLVPYAGLFISTIILAASTWNLSVATKGEK
jgi:amino acid permease